MKKIIFFIFLFPLATLTYAHAASGLLINGSYHTTLDTEKYSVICSVHLEFSNNGTQLIYSAVDNQVNGSFCSNKQTILYKCKQDTSAGRISCADEINPANVLNFIVANDHRFVDAESRNIFKFINAGIKKATVYVYDVKNGWKFFTESELCTMPSGASKRCFDITKQEIDQYVCPDTLKNALAEAKYLCDSHEDNCQKVYDTAFPEFTEIETIIKDRGCRAVVAYKKVP